jgi:hypothetical protein
MRRISEVFDGMKPFVICAGVLLFFGVLAILIELQSASFVQWDGIKVHGDTYGGVTTYKYKGTSYSIDNIRVSADNLHHIPTTVWLSRSNPTDSDQAFIESAWDRWTDFVFLTSWFFGALLFVVVGFVRTLVRRRRRDVTMLQERFGTGLDPAIVERMLAERRRPPPVIHVDDV